MNKDIFVEISNYERFEDGISKAEDRGASEDVNVLVVGVPGTGKTEIIQRWATQNRAFYLRAKQNWKPHQFITELAKMACVDTGGSAQGLFDRLLTFIVQQNKALVIDEVNFCLDNNAAVMEKIRDFSDLSETLVIYSGDDRVIPKISRHPQLARRFSSVVKFELASLNDVRLLCTELAEVDIADDLVAEIHKQSAGRVNNVIDAIAVAERVGKRTGGRVSRNDCIGQSLMFDWTTRSRLEVAPGKKGA